MQTEIKIQKYIDTEKNKDSSLYYLLPLGMLKMYANG